MQGNGNLVTENRDIGDFVGILNTTSLPVEYIAGAERKVEVRMDANLQEYYVTEIRGNVLRLSA